jgi:hypothetical protein
MSFLLMIILVILGFNHETQLGIAFYLQVFCSHDSHPVSATIKIFRSDSGGEFLSDNIRQILTLEGTLAQLSCPGAHAQNGVAERKHRHIIESASTLLISSFVPSHFWSEAVSTAVYLINRQPSSKLSGKTPGEVLLRTSLRYDHLRVFGSLCYVLLPPQGTFVAFVVYCMV